MSISQSFIIRIWLETTADEPGGATWRGSITHVPSGERRYVHELDDIIEVAGRILTEVVQRLFGQKDAS